MAYLRHWFKALKLLKTALPIWWWWWWRGRSSVIVRTQFLSFATGQYRALGLSRSVKISTLSVSDQWS